MTVLSVLTETVTRTIGADGTARAEFGSPRPYTRWTVTRLTTACDTPGPLEARFYRGPSPTVQNFIDGSSAAAGDASELNNGVNVFPGGSVSVHFTNGMPGCLATATLYGTIDDYRGGR